MKINWFKRTYYGKNLQYKRPVRLAFRMFLVHDIYDKITGRAWFGNDAFNGTKPHYRWNKKKAWKKHIKENPLPSGSRSYYIKDEPGMVGVNNLT